MDRIDANGVSLVVPNTNHYTVLLGRHPRVKSALRAFLEAVP